MCAIAHDPRLASGFSLIMALTLALGIGATIAIFSLVEPCCTPVTAREIGTYSKATSAFSTMGGYINVRYELSGGTRKGGKIALWGAFSSAMRSAVSRSGSRA